MQLAQQSQLTTASMSPTSRLCKFTDTKTSQDNSTWLILCRDKLPQAAGGRAGRTAGDQVGGQSAEQQQWLSIFTHPTAATSTVSNSRLFRVCQFSGGSVWPFGGGWQGGSRACPIFTHIITAATSNSGGMYENGKCLASTASPPNTAGRPEHFCHQQTA